MRQIILTNGRAASGMFDYAPGNGIIYEGEHNVNDIVTLNFTRNAIDNPAVERFLRERYGFGDNLPEVQTKYNPKTKEFERDTHSYIESGDVVYSIIGSDGEKIHRGKLSGEELPMDLKIKILKYVGI